MALFRKRPAEPEPRPRPIAPVKPKKGKCKIKWKVGKDGSETFESTPECRESDIERAMKMRINRRENENRESD